MEELQIRISALERKLEIDPTMEKVTELSDLYQICIEYYAIKDPQNKSYLNKLHHFL